MIAMALACNPRLLIADEPTTALDVMVQAQVLQLLEELQRDLGLAMVFITHDLSVLTSVCERLAVMYAGRIVEEGPSAEVFSSPSHPYTRALVRAFPTIGDAASRMAPSGLAGDPPDPADLPLGCPFHPRCPDVRDECPTLDAQLWPSGADRRAACIEVRPERDGDAVTLLEVDDLHVQFTTGRGTLRAVDGVDLAIAEGEVVALVGESGCGKTTLARTIVGLERPTRGRVNFEGTPKATRGRARARVPPQGADGVPGPDRRAQPAPDHLRSGRRGSAGAPHLRRRGGPRRGERSRKPASGRRSGSSPATRTRCRAASASGS